MVNAFSRNQNLYVYSSGHSLKLAVPRQAILNLYKTVLKYFKNYMFFFNTSKRNNVLKNKIEKGNHSLNITTLKRPCATRWLQRYDALNDFF